MRLRVLVSAAGTPRAVSSDPIDVLENGVVGARWTVADAHETDVPQNDARASLLRVLQARAGAPAQPPRRVLVRLPRRLSGPRLHRHFPHAWWPSGYRNVEERGAGGWAEVVRWLRGLAPTPPVRPTSERNARAVELVNVDFVPACWELSFEGAGLGLPKPLPRRRRRWQTVDLHGPFTNRRADMVVYDDLLPGPLANTEAVAREVARVVSAAGARASDVRVEGDQVHFTATVERPLEEAPELPMRSAIGPNDPAPELMPITDVPPVEPGPPPRPPRATLAALRRARAELEAQAVRTNADGTYNAYLGSRAMYELCSDPEFQRMSMGLLYDNQEADGSVLSICGLRLFERRGAGWSVGPGGAHIDFRIDLYQFAPAVSSRCWTNERRASLEPSTSTMARARGWSRRAVMRASTSDPVFGDGGGLAQTWAERAPRRAPHRPRSRRASSLGFLISFFGGWVRAGSSKRARDARSRQTSGRAVTADP